MQYVRMNNSAHFAESEKCQKLFFPGDTDASITRLGDGCPPQIQMPFKAGIQSLHPSCAVDLHCSRLFLDFFFSSKLLLQWLKSIVTNWTVIFSRSEISSHTLFQLFKWLLLSSSLEAFKFARLPCWRISGGSDSLKAYFLYFSAQHKALTWCFICFLCNLSFVPNARFQALRSITLSWQRIPWQHSVHSKILTQTWRLLQPQIYADLCNLTIFSCISLHFTRLRNAPP